MQLLIRDSPPIEAVRQLVLLMELSDLWREVTMSSAVQEVLVGLLVRVV